MNPIKKWHKLMKSNNPSKFDELLDENCIFYSPVVFTPIRGREMTKLYLMAAGGVFGEGSSKDCLLYTSDAADESRGGDFSLGRVII